MFDDNNFDGDTDTTGTDAGDGDLTLDEINEMGLHPDLLAISERFAATLQMIDNWPAKKALDALIGEAMLRGLEVGHVAGRFGVSVAMRF